MKEVLIIHNSSRVDVVEICVQLRELGWKAEWSCGISRTRILSNTSISIASSVIEDVMTDPCVNCGCNPIIKSKDTA